MSPEPPKSANYSVRRWVKDIENPLTVVRGSVSAFCTRQEADRIYTKPHRESGRQRVSIRRQAKCVRTSDLSIASSDGTPISAIACTNSA